MEISQFLSHVTVVCDTAYSNSIVRGLRNYCLKWEIFGTFAFVGYKLGFFLPRTLLSNCIVLVLQPSTTESRHILPKRTVQFCPCNTLLPCQLLSHCSLCYLWKSLPFVSTFKPTFTITHLPKYHNCILTNGGLILEHVW